MAILSTEQAKAVVSAAATLNNTGMTSFVVKFDDNAEVILYSNGEMRVNCLLLSEHEPFISLDSFSEFYGI